MGDHGAGHVRRKNFDERAIRLLDESKLSPEKREQISKFDDASVASLFDPNSTELDGFYPSEAAELDLVLATYFYPEEVVRWLLADDAKSAELARLKIWFKQISVFAMPGLNRTLAAAVGTLWGASSVSPNHGHPHSADTGVSKWLTQNGLEVGELHRLFALIHRQTSDAPVLTKIASDIDQLISDSPEAIVDALPWLIAQPMWQKDEIVKVAASEHTMVLQELRSIATRAEFEPIKERSEGLTLQVAGDISSIRASALRWRTDRAVFSVPEPLCAPTSTWLSDASLEASLRSAVNRASSDILLDHITTEVMITGAFLKALQIRLEGLNELSLTGSKRTLSVGLSAPRNLDEKVNGADVAVVMNVAGRSLKLSRAHFIQVKATKDSVAPTWSINIAQALALLETDQTASYWLIGPAENKVIHVVPAAFLAARAAAIHAMTPLGTPKRQSFTAYYAEIANVSTTVAQELVDLVIGLWLGTGSSRALEYVDESTPSRRVGQVLTITVHGEDL